MAVGQMGRNGSRELLTVDVGHGVSLALACG